jgi:multidrug transporter EmrE-like cation transporter
MDTTVFLAVMFAALLHASWNALIKLRLDPRLGITLMQIASGLVALPLAFWAAPMPLTAWGWLIASVIVHVGYNMALGEAYRAGDLGQAYPIARGSAPLLTTIGTALLIGESPSLLGVAGVSLWWPASCCCPYAKAQQRSSGAR